MLGKGYWVAAERVERPSSDVEGSLRPVITISRILLCFPLLRCNLSSERSGVIPRFLRILSSIFLSFVVLCILASRLVSFRNAEPKNRLFHLFYLFFTISYLAVSSAFYFISSYKNGSLLHLIRLHNDFTSALLDFGCAISTFRVIVSAIHAPCMSYFLYILIFTVVFRE